MPEEALASALGTIDHIGIVVADLAAARWFAAEVLGLEETRAIELPELAMRACFFRCGSCELEFIEITDADRRADRLPAGAQAHVEHLALRVGDLEAAGAVLSAAGARWSSEPGGAASDVAAPLTAAGAQNIWTDPSTTLGVMWQLVERAEQSR